MARRKGFDTRDFAAPPSAYLAKTEDAPIRKRLPRRRKSDLIAISEQAYLREDGAVMVLVGEGRSVNRAFLRRALAEDAT